MYHNKDDCSICKAAFKKLYGNGSPISEPPSTLPMGQPVEVKGQMTFVKKTGFCCKKCNYFNEFAESNQEDGSYVCFGCR